MPGYLVAVVVILTLLPDAKADLTVWLANLTLTQIYVPLTLTAGLTQMWSLSVEVAFYIALPFLALLVRWVPVRARIGSSPPRRSPASAGAAVAADPRRTALRCQPAELAAGVPVVVRGGHAARGADRQPDRVDASAGPAPGGDGGHRGGRLPGGGLTAGRPGRPHAGHGRSVHRQDGDGAIVAGALLAPLVLDRPDTPHRFLGSATMVTLGRWSYGLFVWHLAALAMVFPVIGEFAFNGHMPVVLVLTVVFGFAIAAVSYALVESPCRNALRRWETKFQPTPLDSSVDDSTEPAVAR